MGSEGFVERGGVAAATFRGIYPEFSHFRGSQWSTLESGPLAHAFSGDLPGFPPFPGKLVVHFPKWTTGSRHFGAFTRIAAFFQEASGPLFRVDH